MYSILSQATLCALHVEAFRVPGVARAWATVSLGRDVNPLENGLLRPVAERGHR